MGYKFLKCEVPFTSKLVFLIEPFSKERDMQGL